MVHEHEIKLQDIISSFLLEKKKNLEWSSFVKLHKTKIK